MAAVEALLVGHEHEVAREWMELRDRAFDRSNIRFFLIVGISELLSTIVINGHKKLISTESDGT
jgi:hypothetical protein